MACFKKSALQSPKAKFGHFSLTFSWHFLGTAAEIQFFGDMIKTISQNKLKSIRQPATEPVTVIEITSF